MQSGCKDKKTKEPNECDESFPVLGDINPADITDLLLNNPGLSIFNISNYFKCGSFGSNSSSENKIEKTTDKCEAFKKKGETSNDTQSKDPKQKTIIRGRINEPAVLEEIKGIDEEIEGIIKQIDVKQIDENIEGIIKQIREKAQAGLLPHDEKPETNTGSPIKVDLKDITEKAVLGSLQRDTSEEYKSVIDFLEKQIEELQEITKKSELKTFIRKNDEIARKLFKLSGTGRSWDKREVYNYCDFFRSNKTIDRSDAQQERIIALCTQFNQKLAAKKEEPLAEGGKRKRRNSQKKSNKNKKKKSKASRKKKRN